MLEDAYKALLDNLNQSRQCAMLTHFYLHDERKGTIMNKMLLTKDDIKSRSFNLPDEIYKKIDFCLNSGMLTSIKVEQDEVILIEPFKPKPRLVVFGGGHIAKPLSEFSNKVGFSVTVIDDRPFFANNERFPEADKVICENFEKCFNSLNLQESDYAVIVTRGHKYDSVVLRQVLKYDLSYIGMIGSKRRVSAMRDELIDEGFSESKLDLVNAPIGLDIGAITPDEIAISIVSQLISCKNKALIDKFGKNLVLPELDMEVIERTSEKCEMPKTIITILSTKGSVPRKAGAKMLTFYDGKTVGSIGGGCSEAEVLTKAKDIMLNKGFSLEYVDMTGEAAENEGMVCGGIMEVLIEAI